MFYFLLSILLLINCTKVSTLSSSKPSASSGYWPTLTTQCTSALQLLNSFQVSFTPTTSVSCCYNASPENPIGDTLPSINGTFIGCSIDSQGRSFVQSIQIQNELNCSATHWPSFPGLPSLSVL